MIIDNHHAFHIQRIALWIFVGRSVAFHFGCIGCRWIDRSAGRSHL